MKHTSHISITYDNFATACRQQTDGNTYQSMNACSFMFWNRVSEILASTTKTKLLQALQHEELDQRFLAKHLKLQRANCRRALRGMCITGLVVCLTPERPKTKMYALTPLGNRVWKRVSSIMAKEALVIDNKEVKTTA